MVNAMVADHEKLEIYRYVHVVLRLGKSEYCVRARLMTTCRSLWDTILDFRPLAKCNRTYVRGAAHCFIGKPYEGVPALDHCVRAVSTEIQRDGCIIMRLTPTLGE
jgi:hypothetical protein